jgi:protein regulator of cytokinesis 1
MERVISFDGADKVCFVELRATLEVLSNLLGPPFEPPSPLQPVASSSKSVAPPGPSRSSLNRNAGNLVSGGGYRRSASGGTLVQAIEEGKKEIWLDVGEEITEILEVAVQKAMEERVSLSSWTCG